MATAFSSLRRLGVAGAVVLATGLAASQAFAANASRWRPPQAGAARHLVHPGQFVTAFSGRSRTARAAAQVDVCTVNTPFVIAEPGEKMEHEGVVTCTHNEYGELKVCAQRYMNGQWVNRACKSTGLKTAGTFHIDWVRSCTRGAKYRTWSWTYIEGGDPATVTLVSHTATCYG